MIRNDDYRDGLAGERDVKRRLEKELGWTIKASSREEDIVYDIDAWVRTEYSHTLLPISIKVMKESTWYRSKSVAFELEVQLVDGTWKPSWYHNGKAAAYVVATPEGVYYISKAKLADYINRLGWPQVTQNRADTVQKQRDMGHPHIDAKLGLVQMTVLLNAGVATRLPLTSDTKPNPHREPTSRPVRKGYYRRP
jgi:hypothetical protein